MKIGKSHKEFGLLIKHVSKTIKNKVQEQKDGFLRIFLGTLDTSLLESILVDKPKIPG